MQLEPRPNVRRQQLQQQRRPQPLQQPYPALPSSWWKDCCDAHASSDVRLQAMQLQLQPRQAMVQW
jgi:hypothetical protein